MVVTRPVWRRDRTILVKNLVGLDNKLTLSQKSTWCLLHSLLPRDRHLEKVDWTSHTSFARLEGCGNSKDQRIWISSICWFFVPHCVLFLSFHILPPLYMALLSKFWGNISSVPKDTEGNTMHNYRFLCLEAYIYTDRYGIRWRQTHSPIVCTFLSSWLDIGGLG